MTDRFWWSTVTAVIRFEVIVVVEPFDGIQAIILPRVRGLIWTSHQVVGHQLGGAPHLTKLHGPVDERVACRAADRGRRNSIHSQVENSGHSRNAGCRFVRLHTNWKG